MNSGIAAAPLRMIFGEWKVQGMLKASLENWERLANFIEDIVE